MENQLVELTTETALTVFTADNGLDPYVQQVKDEVNNFEHDLSTGAGRKRSASLAAKVAKMKVKLDNLGKDLVAEWKNNSKKVDSARKKMRDELDELKVTARKPLSDWEEEQERAEAEKQAKIEAEMKAAQVESDHEIGLLINANIDREVAEEKARIESANKVEAERLKQVQIDNDARIAKEAAEAATIEAKRLAQKSIDDAEELKQKAINDKIQADKDLLAAQARENLLNEQAAQARSNKEWLEYISEAYDHNNQLNAKAEQERQSKIAEQSRLDSIEAARLAQIKVQEDERKAAAAAQAKLEANQKHVSMVRGEIKAHLMQSCDIGEELAIDIVKALLKIKTRVTINY